MLKDVNKKVLAGVLATGVALTATSCSKKADTDDSKNISSSSEEVYLVTEDNSVEEVIEEEKKEEYIPTIMALSDINIRQGPSFDTDVYDILPAGEMLVRNGDIHNDWYQVWYQGKLGYVHAGYVTESYMKEAQYYDNVYICEDTKFYDAENNNVVDIIPKYQTSWVYDKKDNMYLIKYNDTYGWVDRYACRVLRGNYVVVDISDQKLDVYSNNNRWYETRIVSGKDSTPSDIGLFHIYDKAMNVTLYGDDYATPVTYWMPYNGGEGLHDAYWRYEFGGEIYHYDGSHGCINMDFSDAERLYENLEVGDKVLVKE